MGFFKRRSKKKDKFIEEAVQEAAAPLKGASAQHHVVDLCEQIIDASRELDDAREEYNTITSYLTDVQRLEDMPKEQRKVLEDYATKVAKLNKDRDMLLNMESKLTDAQFARMQEDEDVIPTVVKRLKDNETYLTAIKKDMNTLEAEKMQWSMSKTDAKKRMNKCRKWSKFLLGAFGVLVVILIAVTVATEANVTLPLIVCGSLVAVAGVFFFIRYQDAASVIKKADVNRNHAVSLENHVKIKYVNMKNAVDYTCEKYHVSNSMELSYQYEQYQEMVKQRERFKATNEDLDYYRKALLQALEKLRFYDARFWLNCANAIIDKKEMVEVKHDLITRRQKVRSRMEYNLQVIGGMREEVMRYSSELGENETQIRLILEKIDELNHKSIS